jgi:hypothetical protein
MAKSRKRTTSNLLTMPRPAWTTESANPNYSAIATRAFELYCNRGCQDGHDVEDWLQAERELQLSEEKSSAALSVVAVPRRRRPRNVAATEEIAG